MKNFLLITTLLFSAVSHAATLPPAVVPGLPALPAAEGLKTYGAGLPLAELLKLTLGQVLHRPYVLTPAVSADPVLISADFTGVKPADVLAVLRQVLQPAGFSITDVGACLSLIKFSRRSRLLLLTTESCWCIRRVTAA